jgi:hypothetical protein
MQLGATSTVEEVAAVVSEALTSAGITAVLSGGAAVQIYTSGLYKSHDLDFVTSGATARLWIRPYWSGPSTGWTSMRSSAGRLGKGSPLLTGTLPRD